MPVSLPSAKVVVADVPEVKNLKGKFVYNFFEPDERENGTGQQAPEFAQEIPAENFDAKFIKSKRFNQFTSRYVQLNWQARSEPKRFAPRDLKIKDNLDKIYLEQDFLANDYTSIIFQDTNVNETFNYFLKKLIQRQRDQEEPDNVEEVIDNGWMLESPTELAKNARDSLSDEIDDEMICESLIDLEEEGIIFKDSKGEKIQKRGILDDLRDVRTYGHINNRFLWKIMQTSLRENLSVHEDEITELKDDFAAIQRVAQTKNPNVLTGEEYDVEIQDFVGEPKKLTVDGYTPKKEILGYVIEKTEVTDEDEVIEHEPLVIEGSNVNKTLDFKIKYGSRYRYTIRAIAYVESVVEEIESNPAEEYVIAYLLSSKHSHMIEIECIEDTAPPPPADFKLRWDANKKQLMLMWNFPINPQRDIKQWQIFRREDIDEPYELLKVYDFDDSTILDEDGYAETPDPLLVEAVDNPKNFYVDTDFVKNPTTGQYPVFIYTVCSVDAHGLSSNYSTQIECTFDKFENKLVQEVISTSGAPKAYPNFYLELDTFVDTIRVSQQKKKMRVYFMPEYLKLMDSKGNDLGLIKTGDDEFYKLNLINVDLQEQQNLEIKIKDQRTTPRKAEPVLLKPEEENRFGRRRKRKTGSL